MFPRTTGRELVTATYPGDQLRYDTISAGAHREASGGSVPLRSAAPLRRGGGIVPRRIVAHDHDLLRRCTYVRDAPETHVPRITPGLRRSRALDVVVEPHLGWMLGVMRAQQLLDVESSCDVRVHDAIFGGNTACAQHLRFHRWRCRRSAQRDTARFPPAPRPFLDFEQRADSGDDPADPVANQNRSHDDVHWRRYQRGRVAVHVVADLQRQRCSSVATVCTALCHGRAPVR